MNRQTAVRASALSLGVAVLLFSPRPDKLNGDSFFSGNDFWSVFDGT
jgi:hypothetical protein